MFYGVTVLRKIASIASKLNVNFFENIHRKRAYVFYSLR